MKSESIIAAINGVTKKWVKNRKAEERAQSRRSRRYDYMVSSRISIKDAAEEVMEEAYLKASGGGKLPAHARQIMYAARGRIQEITGRSLNDKYFTQTLLPDYMAQHGVNWDVAFDARGHFTEPHTKRIVPLGTLEVRNYLHKCAAHAVPDIETSQIKTTYPTCGPEHRFSAILFIEKEGFMPLFEAVDLAKRYDIAIMSTKGMSVTASRQLVDDLCGAHSIPLLVLHDFDKAGFSIVGTLKRDTRRYEFCSRIEVIDLGIRLEDISAHNLESETVSYGKADPSWNLRENGATDDEIAYLCSERGFCHCAGRRVELNSFSSDELVSWIESKLAAHRIRKLPDDESLAAAYRRVVRATYINKRLKEITTEAAELADAEIPSNLRRRIAQRLRKQPALAWDRVIADMASEKDPG